MDKISVIIPVYNAGNKIKRCLESILRQSYSNLEIICVDDGSTDQSGQILDEYAHQDNRIVVIHQKNSGVSSARNTGLNHANGEYIGFVDADDYIEDKMYEVLYKMMVKNHSGIGVVAVETNFSNDGSLNEMIFSNGQMVITNFYKQNLSRYFLTTVWNKLFHVSVIKNCRFSEKIPFSEDRIFFMQALSHCKDTVSYTPYIGYYYQRTAEGIIRSRQINFQTIWQFCLSDGAEYDLTQDLWIEFRIFTIIQFLYQYVKSPKINFKHVNLLLSHLHQFDYHIYLFQYPKWRTKLRYLLVTKNVYTFYFCHLLLNFYRVGTYD